MDPRNSNKKESSHTHSHYGTHAHTHGTIDSALLTTQRGIWAVKWSLISLAATTLFQALIVIYSGSVALLADTIHNFSDASTSIPLWIAFVVARRAPTRRFTYGYGRVEDIAGLFVVLTIFLSAIIAGYESVNRLLNPQPVENLWAVALASIVGVIGNEMVAVFRIRVGRQIKSASLVADGYHARVDGLSSLSVLIGAIGIWLGYPLADPIVGLAIAIAILIIVWKSGKSIFIRLIDGVDPEVIDEIKHVASHCDGIQDVAEVRVRWLGHRLHTEVCLSVHPTLSVEEGHAIALQVRHELLHRLPHLSNATIHVDPQHLSGEVHHRINEHAHEDLAIHSHQ